MSEFTEINFNGGARTSRLSKIEAFGFDNSSGTATTEMKTRSYVMPKMTPRIDLEMEARSCINLWGASRTNSIRICAETENKRTEIKELIKKWRLADKLSIPPKYTNQPELVLIFNSFPMFCAGIKIFSDYMSHFDPLFEHKGLRILNMKTLLTEKAEICRKTGATYYERQIIICRQLDLAPAFRYVSAFIRAENLKEQIRYQVKYGNMEFDDEAAAANTIECKFDYDDDSLNMRKNWVPLEGQTEGSVESDFTRWINMIISQDILYISRLEQTNKAALLAIRNKVDPKRATQNFRKVYDLETFTRDLEEMNLESDTLNNSIRSSELGSYSLSRTSVPVLSVRPTKKQSRRERSLLSRSLTTVKESEQLDVSFVVIGNQVTSDNSGMGPEGAFFENTSTETFLALKRKKSVISTTFISEVASIADTSADPQEEQGQIMSVDQLQSTPKRTETTRNA
jgi:hypothetical protein